MAGEPQEDSDLLSTKDRAQTNGNAVHYAASPNPPDGGLRAYAVMVGSFLTNGLLFGFINSYSVVYPVLSKKLADAGVSNADSRAALVGSLSMGTTFLMSPISGVLTGLLGIQYTTILGGLIATTGLVLSSFLTDNVDALNFSFGIMYGVGASFAYTPSLAILGHYFKKHLGQVNGFVCVGSSVFTVLMIPLVNHVLIEYGMEWMFRVVAVFTFGVALCGFLFKPLIVIQKPIREDKTAKSLFKSIVNVEIWKIRKYMIWALSIPIALFGYFVPYVHINKFMRDSNYTDAEVNVPIQCMMVTSGLGRLLFGYLADKPGMDRILLQQISFYVIGTLTIIIPFVSSMYWLLVVICAGMGIFDGAFISMMGPIAFELCGEAYAAQAIGCVLGLAAIPLSIGPPIAAYIYRKQHESYTIPFVVAGISPLLGATSMFAVRLKSRSSNRRANTNGHVPLSRADVEKSPAPLLTPNGNTKEQTSL